ncbi:MAG TPA: folylpolyglutamate synthase/dihydrofolate synthase family protein [Thermoanaerobaculia bacterium]|nr:folylpolyglutamate synthase/dihydrofolate synthase family protein [Thermoanaerobaculia bacterium]
MPDSAAALLGRLEASGIRLGLENLGRLLTRLGSPERRFPSVLIAGTNGKGSTSALLAAMATAAGYRTGLYTSPHLETVEERLRINTRAVPTERLGDLLSRVVAAANAANAANTADTADAETGGPPTYFEALTAAAFLWFAEEEVDLAVLEVGLGGRLDATNLADPLLSLITPVSFDHQEYLGDTLAAIAREKAGILRRGRPALAWIEEAEPADAVRTVAAEVGADLRFAPAEVRIEEIEPQRPPGRGQRLRLVTPVGRYDLKISLLGAHQAKNLGLAVRAAEILAGAGFPRLDAGAVARGAAACRWPGRLEEVEISGGRRVLLDAAHNPGGAETLGAFLAGAPDLGHPVDLLFGVLADKDVRGILAPLAPHVGRFVFTTPASPRAQDPATLAGLLPERPDGSAAEIYVEPQPEAALDRALALGGKTLVACGSIFLIGEIRRLLRERFGVPAPAA